VLIAKGLNCLVLIEIGQGVGSGDSKGIVRAHLVTAESEGDR
jgi:hypothetical protein